MKQCLVVIAALLAGCSQETHVEDFASCRMAMMQTPRKLSETEADRFVATCMESKGYRHTGTGDCFGYVNATTDMSCYYKKTMIGEIVKKF